MVKIKGLKGIRPKQDLVEKIASKPYDVLNSEEARVAAAGNPYSFLHVVKSEIDLPADIDHYDEKVYLKAAENLQTMIKKGWLIQDRQDCIYVYRQTMDGHEQYGLVVDASVDDYLKGNIKIHELTREVKEKDRINHVKYTNANTGPVFLTYKANDKIDEMVISVIKNKPEVDFTADDGMQHTLWVINNPEKIKTAITQFDRIPFTYVADGHHRSKSAAMVGEMRRKANPDHTGTEEYNWFLAVLFPHDQLKIAQKSGVRIFGPVVNTLTNKTIPWNLSRAITLIKACVACADIPVHGSMGMGVGGLPVCETLPVDILTVAAKAMVEITRLDGL